MASRVLIHPPEPEPSKLADLPPVRPPIGEEFLPGWTACAYSLIRGDWNGEEYEYVVWVMPTSSGCS
jgi:hypothetical protein